MESMVRFFREFLSVLRELLLLPLKMVTTPEHACILEILPIDPQFYKVKGKK
jgi:hypothetical protein